MRPAEKIENLIQNLNNQTRPELDEKILDACYTELNTQQSSTPAKGPTIWSILMKNPITKYAATLFVITGLLCTFLLSNFTPQAIAFQDVIKAMENVSWMHQTSRGFEGNISGTAEQWIGFKSKVHAGKWANGKASYWDIKNHRKYEYDPEKESITIDYTQENDFPLNLSSPTMLLESMHKVLIEQGAEIVTTSAEYIGQIVQLQEILLSIQGQSQVLQLYIHPKSKLLLAAHVTGKDKDGNIMMDGEINFSYPPTGPSDIYALGVPRETPIISNLPNEDYLTVWEQYRHNREMALNDYIAIITHEDQSLNGVVTMVDIDYKSNKKHRLERHSVFNAGEIYDKFWPEYQKQLGDSFESLLIWTQDHYNTNGSISIYLYDGDYNTSISRTDGQWSDLRKHYSPDWASFPNITLGDIAWPVIDRRGAIVEDEFAKENNYICIERLQQGSIYNGEVQLPGRFLYYLNPQKNCMCVRKIREWNPEAEWQEDKNWLDGIAPEKIRDGSLTMEDVTETVQAENGNWYPSVIEEYQSGIRKDYKESPLKIARIKTVYIQSNPEFPEGVFDIKSLPK
jgi:hypothetical protein